MNDTSKRRLTIVDAGSVYHPAYHVMTGFSTRDGFPTGAVYGFTRTVLRLLREYPADYVAITFDTAAPTHRHDLFAGYKANRPPLPDDLRMQIPVIEEVIDALGLPRFALDGFEADDLMATLAFQAKDQDMEAVILSGDKDMMQLVNDHIFVLKTSRQPGQAFERYDRDRVKEYLGVYPHQVADFLALMGDSSDQIPGVPSIGKKTAQKLLEKFDSLAALLERFADVENARARNALEKHRKDAELSYNLARLRPMSEGPTLEQCQRRKPDMDQLKALFEKLEFHSFLQEFDLVERKTVELDVNIVQDSRSFAALLNALDAAEWVSLDLETTGTDARRAEIVGIALSFEPSSGFYVPLAHEGDVLQLDRDQVLTKLRPYLEGGLPIIGQNLKYDAKVLRRYDIWLKNIAFDTMLGSYLLDPAARQHGLDVIARRFLGYETSAYSDLSDADFRKVPLDEAARYAVEDAEVVVRARKALVEELEDKSLQTLFETLELPLIDVLVQMELKGILLDPSVLEIQGQDLGKQLILVKADLFQLAGEQFNPNSPKQVAHILFDVLGLPVLKRTKTGPSTDALVLSELAMQHDFPGKLIYYRELEKLLNTYIHKLPEYVDSDTGRIYTSFHQAVTATGRLSSSDPNLQNIPVRTEIGGEIRKAFIAPPGRLLLAADYSQIELRVLAHLSQDEKLLETFQAGEDLHERTACEIFNVHPGLITSAMRSAAKRVNFGILYGISAFRLAKELGIPQAEAKGYIDRFFEIYPGVKMFIDGQIQLAKTQGYVSTLMGRRRYLPAINSRNFNQRSFDERNAVNAPIQGSAADLMKLAMISVHQAIQAGDVQADMLLQVHDELIFELDEGQAEAAGQNVKELMENVFELDAPLKVEVKTGNNWGEV